MNVTVPFSRARQYYESSVTSKKKIRPCQQCINIIFFILRHLFTCTYNPFNLTNLGFRKWCQNEKCYVTYRSVIPFIFLHSKEGIIIVISTIRSSSLTFYERLEVLERVYLRVNFDLHFLLVFLS